jgi:hypothetical protein
MTQNPAVKKFTNAQWNNMVGMLSSAQIEAFEKAGMVPGAQGPGEHGKRDEQSAIFKQIVDQVGLVDGRKSINVVQLLDAGFPPSARFPTNWSQLSPGSEIAYEWGWKSSMRTERKMVKGKGQDSFLLIVDLVKLTEEHRTARQQALDKKKAPTVVTSAPSSGSEQLPSEV